jgi:phosphopantetheinyl transferase (holo-ACP synthase)
MKRTGATITAELDEKATALLAAAYAFWEAHQKAYGTGAVVWLGDDDGKLVVFTRMEYRDGIMGVVDRLNRLEEPLEWPNREDITKP